MKRHIQKDCSATNRISENRNSKPTKSSKPVQYFTFGKDNCLVQLTTTSQNKKSSTNAIFCKIDPFKTSGDNVNYRKVKSSLGLPYTQKKYTLHTNVHQEAISKLTKKLKHDLAFSAINSDINSIIIEGKSIKLNPKKSFCDLKTYCKGIKRCKMCGEVMLDFDPSISPISNRCSSIDSCSDCKLNKMSNIMDKNVEKSKGYGNYLFPKKVTTTTSSAKLPSSFKPIKNVVFSNATGRQTNESANYNASDDFSTKPKCDIGELAQARALIREYSKKEANGAIKLAPNSKTNMPVQTKATFINDRLNTKSKNLLEKFNVESNLSQEQFKNANTGCKSAFVKKSSINAIAKSLSEKNRISTRSKDNTEKLPSEHYVGRKQCKNTNMTSAKTLTEKSSKPAQIKLLSEANHFIAKSKSTIAELTTKNYVNKGRSKTTSVGNKGASTDESNVPAQVESLRHSIGHNIEPKSTSYEFMSEIYIDKDDGQNVNMDAATCNNISEEFTPGIYIDGECQNTNMSSKRGSNEESDMPIQTSSLNETNRPTTNTTNINGKCSSDSAIERQQYLNRNVSNKIVSIEEENMPTQIQQTPKSKSTLQELTTTIFIDQEESANANIDTSKSNSILEEFLSETSQTTTESNTSEIITPENYINNDQCHNTNMANKSTSTDKLNVPFQFESLTQEELDLLSKCADILHGINSCDKDRSSSSDINNVSVNNYYFLTGSDLKKAKCNSSVVHNFSPTKHFSSESISILSENEDDLEVDKVKEQNGFQVNQEKSSILLLKFKKAILEELCGVFKLKTDKFLEDLCQSQYDVPFYNDRCSESDHCTSIGKVSSESSNIYHDILRQQIALKNLNLPLGKNTDIHSQDAQSLYGIKTLNPYIQKSLRIIEEMDQVRNEPIDPDKVLEELKKDKHLMKTVEKMAAKKLNFSRKMTVFKNLAS